MKTQIIEPLAPGLTRVWRVEEVLADHRTRYQHAVIARTDQGVTLFCDNERQSSELSQLLYHEALIVPATLLADQVRSALVIGSSEGVASLMLVASGAERVDHVDIDAECVQMCAEFLPYGYTTALLRAAERHDSHIHMHYLDGVSFVASSHQRYDIIVVDLPDESFDAAPQHNRLYESDFLRACQALLNPGGVLVSQAGCPTLWRNATLARSWRRFHEVFETVTYFGSDEHEWSFLCGRARVENPLRMMRGKLPLLTRQPEYFDAESLSAATVAPYSIRRQD